MLLFLGNLRLFKEGLIKKYRRQLDSKMSEQEMVSILYREHPAIPAHSLLVGFFITLAIPNISRRLSLSGELTSQPYSRFDRTLKTIHQILANGYDSTVGRQMVMLMNQKHHPFSIPQEDYLYVLSIYALNSVDWTEKSTQQTENFHLAWFKVWRVIGAAMGIQNIPETPTELHFYQKQYEQENLYYDPINKQLFDSLFNAYLEKQNWRGRILAHLYVMTLLDSRYRRALGLKSIPVFVQRPLQKILYWYFLRAFNHTEIVYNKNKM